MSGYGLQKSFINKENYLEKYLANRLPKIIIPYVVANLVYICFYNIFGIHMSLRNLFIGLVNGSPIVENSWYIIIIMIFYIFFYFAMRFSKKRKENTIYWSILFFIMHIVICRKFNYGSWWYNTFIACIIGIIWATYEARINVILKKYYLLFFLISTISFFLIYLTLFHNLIPNFIISDSVYIKLTMVTSIFFPIIVLLFLLKCNFGNSILNKIGNVSLELYMYHGLFLILFQTEHFMIKNSNVFIILCLVCSYLFSYFINRINQYMLDKYKNTFINKTVIHK